MRGRISWGALRQTRLSSSAPGSFMGRSKQVLAENTTEQGNFIKQNRARLVRRASVTQSIPLRAGLAKIPQSSGQPSLHTSIAPELVNQVIGFVPMPLATVGPLVVNGQTVQVPLANADHNVITRANLGCRAIEASGGSFSTVLTDCYTLSPLVSFASSEDALAFAQFIDNPERIADLRQWFLEASGTLRLEQVKCQVMGPRIFVRFTASSTDGLRSESLSNGVDRVMSHLRQDWKGAMFVLQPDMFEALDISGKTIRSEVSIPVDVVQSILNTDVEVLLAAYQEKQSVKAKIVEGAVARKLVFSIMLATGQDVAQHALNAGAVETTYELIRSTIDHNIITAIKISTTVSNLELSTFGGQTSAAPHQGCLTMIDSDGPSMSNPGSKAQRLAEIISASVLAVEVGGTAKRTALPERPQRTIPRGHFVRRSTLMLPTVEVVQAEAMRGISTMQSRPASSNGANVSIKARETGNSAYLELITQKCAAEFGWADPRLTVP